MKKIILLVIILVVSSFGTLASALDSPIVMGTVDYESQKHFYFDGNASLNFVSSESFSSDALICDFWAYDSSEDLTDYKFVSQPVTTYSWFTPGLKAFIYQDSISGQLYKVYVDYSSLSVPLSAEQILYNKLLIRYDNLSANYTNLSNKYTVLNETAKSMNITLKSYINITNMTNQPLNKTVQKLYGDFLTITAKYNNTNNTLTAYKENYTRLCLDLNNTIENNSVLFGNYTELYEAYYRVSESNTTYYNLFFNKSIELGSYQRFEDDLNSGGTDGFYFIGRYYYPIDYYENSIKQLQDDAGMVPIYLALSVILTLIICFLFYTYKMKSRPISSIDLDTRFNVPKEATVYDHFSMGKEKAKNFFNKNGKEKEHVKKEELNKENVESLKKDVENKIKELDKKMDNKLGSIESSIDKVIEKIR